MSLDDFAPSEEPADNLDEDLFDFPSIHSSGPSPVVPAPSDLESELDDARDLHAELEEQDSLLPSEDQFDDLQTLDMNLDDEDEDLFGFPNPQRLAPQHDLDASLEEAGLKDTSGQDEPLLEEDIDDLIREAKSASARKLEENSGGSQDSDSAPEVLEPAAPPEVQIQAPAAVVPVALSPQGLGASSRALWVFTGASVLFMIGVLLIAWNMSSTFQQQLQVARAQSPATQQAFQQQPSQPYPSDTRQGSAPAGVADVEPGVGGAVVRQPRLPRASSKTLAALESPHESVLVVAESAISDGRFVEARRLLFGLLAEVDRVPPESRDRAEEYATFLIATSHKAEAELLLENPE